MVLMQLKFDAKVADKIIKSVWEEAVSPESSEYAHSYKVLGEHARQYKSKTISIMEVSLILAGAHSENSDVLAVSLGL